MNALSSSMGISEIELAHARETLRLRYTQRHGSDLGEGAAMSLLASKQDSDADLLFKVAMRLAPPSDEFSTVAGAAATALATFATPYADQLVEQLLVSPGHLANHAYAGALGALVGRAKQNDAAAGELLQEAQHSPSLSVRCLLLMAVQTLPEQKREEYWLRGLRDPALMVVDTALERLLSTDALSKSASFQRALMDFAGAKTPADPALRTRAIRLLGQIIRLPEARTILERLAEHPLSPLGAEARDALARRA